MTADSPEGMPAPPPKALHQTYSPADRLAIALTCVSVVIGIVLYLAEKTPLTLAILIVLMVGFAVYPVSHFARSKRARAVALLLVSVVGLSVGWQALKSKRIAEAPVVSKPSTPTPTESKDTAASAPPQTEHEQTTNAKSAIAKKKVAPREGASTSGANSPAVGSITQGAGSAVSINQQGGITAGTVIGEIPPPPRILSSQDATNLTSLTAKYPAKILILYMQHDDEAYHLAKQIGDALTAAGWTLNQPVTEAMMMREGGAPLYGMEVSYKGETAFAGSRVKLDLNSPSGVLTNTLYHLFPNDFEASPAPEVPDNQIWLRVFTNPKARRQ